MNNLKVSICVVSSFVAAVCMPASASADIITYTFEGSASGSLGGVNFGMSNFVVSIQADTSNIEFDLVLLVPNNSASITIDGLGTFDFVTPTLTAYFDSTIYLSWGPQLFDGPDILSVNHGALAGWGLDTEIGPVTGAGDVYSFDSFQTTGGTLLFHANGNPMTFTASIPAPGALAMLAMGGLAIRRRRRNA